jgi:hypothetical protein
MITHSEKGIGSTYLSQIFSRTHERHDHGHNRFPELSREVGNPLFHLVDRAARAVHSKGDALPVPEGAHQTEERAFPLALARTTYNAKPEAADDAGLDLAITALACRNDDM